MVVEKRLTLGCYWMWQRVLQLSCQTYPPGAGHEVLGHGLPSLSEIRLHQPMPAAKLASMVVLRAGWLMNEKEMENSDWLGYLGSVDWAGALRCA